jgi:hypothetical protein
MINPNDITTVRVGQLADSPFNMTDNLPHEVGTELKRGTVQSFADFLALYIGSSSSVAFRAVTVPDGGALPATSQEEWILVGKGTFYNVGGGATIVCTEELNALVSNGTFWSIGVEISIDADLIGITQTILSGNAQTAPSENAVFNALALKANLTDIPVTIPLQIEFTALGGETSHDIGTTALVKSWFWDGSPQAKSQWTQVGSVLNFAFPLSTGSFNIFI